MILQYIGTAEYLDPLGRFIAEPGDLIDYSDQEAAMLLDSQPELFRVYDPDEGEGK